jgi:hypothetical protein
MARGVSSPDRTGGIQLERAVLMCLEWKPETTQSAPQDTLLPCELYEGRTVAPTGAGQLGSRHQHGSVTT